MAKFIRLLVLNPEAEIIVNIDDIRFIEENRLYLKSLRAQTGITGGKTVDFLDRDEFLLANESIKKLNNILDII